MTLNDSYTAALTSTTNAEDVIDTTQTILITTERPEWVVILDYTSTILMTCNVIILMLAMGAATYWREIWDHVKRPWGCLFGMVCQFGFFPALGFGLCIGLQLPTYEALGVLILVCSPGGAFSNFFTYWVDGDLGLRWDYSGVLNFVLFAA
ncbi:hypothetical protein SK128_001242 [Halocaridina rubra]|uniref:Uncharacterized protein n=1 Tax=Halocaridina rubra TaxID=373956 RepID=A0AAN9AEN8_HALRR